MAHSQCMCTGGFNFQDHIYVIWILDQIIWYVSCCTFSNPILYKGSWLRKVKTDAFRFKKIGSRSIKGAILTSRHYTPLQCQTDWSHSRMPKSPDPLPPSTAKSETTKMSITDLEPQWVNPWLQEVSAVSVSLSSNFNIYQWEKVSKITLTFISF